MKKLLIILFLAIILYAEPIEDSNAIKAAEFYLQAFNDFSNEAYELSRHEVIVHRHRCVILGHAFHMEPAGVIVLSADTRITPLIYYSFTSNFSTELNSDNIPMLLIQTDLENRFDYMDHIGNDAVAYIENEALWHSVLSSDDELLRTLSTMTVYGPHLDTNWDQYEPYYNDCPIDPRYPGVHCVTGCVATAMAQIMNYFEFPSSVTFTDDDSYTTYGLGIEIDAPPASIPFINYNGAGSNPTDATIAALCYACGISVEMNYSAGGSSASVNAVDFMDKWQYGFARDIDVGEGSFYTDLGNSMIASKPGPLSISYMDGATRVRGHSVVCDGYNDGTGTFHLNFGWSGTDNGWYTLPTTLPTDYNTVEDAVVDLTMPSYAVYNVPGDFANVQAALNVAIGGDTIVVGNGRHSGVGNRDLSFNGKPVYLRSANGAPACTLDCGASGRGFVFDSDEGRSSIVYGFTFYNGYSSGNGGGIDAGYGTSPTIKNCIFSNCNASSFGGGINAQSSAIHVMNCVFMNCSAWGGGGIYTQFETVELVNNTFTNNSATNGGAVYVNSGAEAALFNNLFWANTADMGTALYITDYFSSGAVAYMDHCLYPSSGVYNNGGTMLYGSGNVNSAPSFHDGYRRLALGSEGINDGAASVTIAIFDNLTVSAPLYDLDGIDRPQGAGFDMGAFEWSIMTDVEEIVPERVSLYCYPNPFNSAINFNIGDEYALTIYDTRGNLIQKLSKDARQWQPSSDTESGVYIVNCVNGNNSEQIKIFYIK